jgi:TetR/AcrR family transcriptional regulator, fatty acid metabolism regulator protein
VTDKQKIIIKAAMDIISREGYSKCTIRNVASRVGVTEPAVYRHFKNKLELLVQILETLQSAVLPSFTLPLEEEMDLESCLGVFASKLFFTLTEHPEYGIFLFFEEAFHQEKELKPTLLAIVERAQEKLTDSVVQLQTRKICRTDLSPESLALILMGTLRLMVSKTHMGFPESWEKLRDQYVELFTLMLKP